ncbi:hypothetical protein K493DRAFT_29957 [Basidiobolus meristosporus CBS 931.73]|uniref:Uncharacterized protein n=1 Tax=Basidiobolus meristosporus CBS 931.73 TaxID=1314790 RepID=A0A1Y1YAC8_9FUNG|nr:hypothetical protein K493DRAFT_29957 [Basidiobolus meristosporus CBS 931.73]|eukprot:ORX94554.1 hypothetical protein K493DRAFT_29957 [Basidiobolus meristosporus CBS 931.73]
MTRQPSRSTSGRASSRKHPNSKPFGEEVNACRHIPAPDPADGWPVRKFRKFTQNSASSPPRSTKPPDGRLTTRHSIEKPLVRSRLEGFKPPTLDPPPWKGRCIHVFEGSKCPKGNKQGTCPPVSNGAPVPVPISGQSPMPQGPMRTPDILLEDSVKSTPIYLTSSWVIHRKAAICHNPPGGNAQDVVPRKIRAESQLTAVEPNPEWPDLGRCLREEGRLAVANFQTLLSDQQGGFHQEITFHLQDHNIDFQLSLNRLLHRYHGTLTRNFSWEMKKLAGQMVEESVKEATQITLMQTTVDSWRTELWELTDLFTYHVNQRKAPRRPRDDQLSWEMLAGGVGVGAVLAWILVRCAR